MEDTNVYGNEDAAETNEVAEAPQVEGEVASE